MDDHQLGEGVWVYPGETLTVQVPARAAGRAATMTHLEVDGALFVPEGAEAAPLELTLHAGGEARTLTITPEQLRMPVAIEPPLQGH